MYGRFRSLGIILYIMTNKAMPFDDTNVKRLNEQQLQRKWKFRSKVVDSLSEQIKNLITHLMEPDVQKRYKIDQLLGSEWLSMDPRLLQLNQAEEQALTQAQIDRKNYIDSLKNAQPEKKMGMEDVKVFKTSDGE